MIRLSDVKVRMQYRWRVRQRLMALHFARLHGPTAAARRFGVSVRTIRRWRVRWRQGSLEGLVPRYPRRRGRRVTPRVIELVGQARRELAYGASRTQLRLRHREGAQDDVPGRAGEARSARAGRVDGHRAAQAPAPVTRQRRDGAVGEAHCAGPPRCSGNSLSTRSGLEPVGEGRERGYKFRALGRSYSSVWAPMANDEKPSEKIKGKEALRGVGFTM